jgi:hypothetical protein
MSYSALLIVVYCPLRWLFISECPINASDIVMFIPELTTLAGVAPIPFSLSD